MNSYILQTMPARTIKFVVYIADYITHNIPYHISDYLQHIHFSGPHSRFIAHYCRASIAAKVKSFAIDNEASLSVGAAPVLRHCAASSTRCNYVKLPPSSSICRGSRRGAAEGAAGMRPLSHVSPTNWHSKCGSDSANSWPKNGATTAGRQAEVAEGG